ncbi:hypothetical protein WBJ53_18390 [Spirosoma sp. SC4-14]
MFQKTTQELSGWATDSSEAQQFGPGQQANTAFVGVRCRSLCALIDKLL